jgi:hypothetical protein
VVHTGFRRPAAGITSGDDENDSWRAMPPKPETPHGYEDDEEDTLDEELEESFPSSDPPSTGGPGI